MGLLEWNNIFWASAIIIALYMTSKYMQKPEKRKAKVVKKTPKMISDVEKSKPLEVSPSKTPQTNEIPPANEVPTQKEEGPADERTILSEGIAAEQESTTDEDIIIEKEPVQRKDKPVIYIKKIIPEFKLKSETHSLELLNKIILKNSGAALAMKLNGSIEYKMKDESLANDPVSSNMPLGPNQSITIENSFNLPLNEIQYIKIANIIKNKQTLDVQDVKPVMKINIQYEGENGDVSDIVHNYQLDFKNETWGLFI